MAYSFRVFAAIYGHRVVDEEGSATINVLYGTPSVAQAKQPVQQIPARYVLRPPGDAAPRPIHVLYGGEDICLFHGRDETSGNPDWLAEIFEWLSAAHEISVGSRDSIGRIPYGQSIFARHEISPLRPHASLLMAWFKNFVNGASAESLPAAESPWPDARHLVISSHDIDFYFAGRWGSLVRVVKNLGIAALVTRSYPFFRDSMRQLLRIAGGARVGDFLPELLRRSSQESISSTFFVLARREHRRDGNYRLGQIASGLGEIQKAGSAVALHGSYRSIVENSDLDSEAGMLQAQTGERPRGSRQHWLRFDQPGKLFASIEQAALEYDSSWGWAEQLGFRNGAAFAFPPYNFAREQAHDFLLIPLVIMDQGLQVAHRQSRGQPAKLAGALLGESRRRGWGGISVLWHNPVEPLSVCDDVNQIFWQQADSKTQYQERWISAEEFMDVSLHRYQEAGLLNRLGHGLESPRGRGGNGLSESSGAELNTASCGKNGDTVE
jgi:hypothetical protein